jgi:hypothetical protein
MTNRQCAIGPTRFKLCSELRRLIWIIIMSGICHKSLHSNMVWSSVHNRYSYPLDKTAIVEHFYTQVKSRETANAVFREVLQKFYRDSTYFQNQNIDQSKHNNIFSNVKLLQVSVRSNHHQADISVHGHDTFSATVWDPILYMIEYIVVFWLNDILFSTTT